MKKPIIGISGSILEEQNDDAFLGYERSYVNNDYIKAVIENGGIPFIIPLNIEDSVVEEQINNIDGLILSGGHDINPLIYNQEPKEKLGKTFYERDRFDYTLIKFALKRNIPILGICRGFQLLNVYFGGSLLQDLSYSKDINIKHDQEYGPKRISHSIKILKNTKLNSIINQDEILVNSFHHQAIDKLAENLKISAISKDGVIEAFEQEDYNFLLGVQWHPEMLHSVDIRSNLIFKEFIKSSASNKELR